jgi:amino acid adenylation domain-containing protein
LRTRGVGHGQLIGLSLDRSLDMVVALLGVLKAGAAYVPLDTAFPVDRLRFIAEDSGLDAVLTTFSGPAGDAHRAQCCAVLPEETPKLMLEELADGTEGEGDPDLEPVTPDSLAYVLYTSGSTGRPKGVEVTHGNVVNFLESMAGEPGVTESDVLLAVTTLSFDIAVLEILLPLIVGGRKVIAPREVAADGARLAELLSTSGATVMQATPATWRMLIEAGYHPDTGLKVLCGGETLSAELAAALTDGGAEVWNLYGPTETTVWSAVSRVAAGQAPVLGRPVANTQLYVLDPHGQPVPAGVPGDIFIGGAGVARGYRHRPELTAERFVSDPFSGGPETRMYQTGDRGMFGADGALQFLGRSDHQLKVRGFRIEPGEIEAALIRHVGVHEVAVVGQHRSDGDVRLVAFVRSEPQSFSAESFRRFLSDRLPSYMIPSIFARVDEFPATANGKVDRAALAVRALDAGSEPQPVAREAVAPRTELEGTIASIWRDVLGVEQVGVLDSFFDLGGHSLLAARVVSRVEANLGVRLPINLFAVRPTVADHAEFVTTERARHDKQVAEMLEWVEGLSEEDAIQHLESLRRQEAGSRSK